MLALVDADIICHRVGFTTENDEEWIARVRCNEMIETMLHETGANEYQLWLSGALENNFRYHICPEYKANRLGKPKPKHYDFIKEHMITEWGAQITYDQEADDALGIEQVKYLMNDIVVEHKINVQQLTPETICSSIICSIDKDLYQIPGNHYNFVKKEQYFVTPEDGLRTFYKQLLIGDTGDNIPGCPGIGVVRASKALNGISNEEQLLGAVYTLYTKAIPGLDRHQLDARILQAGQLLKIRTKKDEVWQLPDFQK